MYEPCYAPVFPPSDETLCRDQTLRLRARLALLFLLYLITFGSRRFRCMMLQTQYRIDHCREGNDDPEIDLWSGLGQWLLQNPRVRNAIVWWPDGDRGVPFIEWTREERNQLFDCYERMRSGEGYRELPPPGPEPAGYVYSPGYGGDEMERPIDGVDFDYDFAWDLYLRFVAHSLLMETTGRLSWSIRDYSDNALSWLLDSTSLFVINRDTGRHCIVFRLHGAATPGDTVRIYRELQSRSLVTSSSKNTILYLLEWCRRNLIHSTAIIEDGEFDVSLQTRAYFDTHWHYQGFPPTEMVFRGTFRDGRPPLRNWTYGCWGTTGFLRAVLRVINIPVTQGVCGHSYPKFISEGVFISHGDDPYTREMTEYTPPIPMEEILIPMDRLDEFFDVNARRCDGVGLGIAYALMEALPDELLAMRCRDRLSGATDRGGLVYAYFRDRFASRIPFNALTEADLWRRMDEKIDRLGGCDNFTMI